MGSEPALPSEGATPDGAGNGPLKVRSEFAVRMSELKESSGLSFGRLAAACDVNGGYLNKLANSDRPAPSVSIARAIGRALGAEDELVELARREHAPPAPAHPRPMDEDDAARVRATLNHLVGLDTLQGSDGLTPLAVRSYRVAADRLAVVGGTADVRAAVADLGAAAAWIAADDVQRGQSKAIALEALAQADLAGDGRLHRFLLSHLSMVAEHGGQYADALAYADRLAAEEHDNPRVAAMVQVRRARALSGLGAHDAATRAWDYAANLLTRTPSTDDGLTYWIHDAEMAIHRAVLLSRAGDRTAVDWAQRGVEWLPGEQGRDQVLFRAMLLHDAVAAHAWREVPAIAEDLIRHADVARSARVSELLGQVWRSVQRKRVPNRARDAVQAAYDALR